MKHIPDKIEQAPEVIPIVFFVPSVSSASLVHFQKKFKMLFMVFNIINLINFMVSDFEPFLTLSKPILPPLTSMPMMPVKTPSDPKKSEVIAIPRLPWRYIGSAMKNF